MEKSILVILAAWILSLPSPSAAQTCTDLGGLPGVHHLRLVSGDLTRDYLLDVPPNYDPTSPAPLIIDYHGHLSNAWQQWYLTDMPRHSRERGFIVAHPNGDKRAWNDKIEHHTDGSTVDDVAFTLDLIDHISADYCVDADRIHAMGFSNGGHMSHRVGCDLADVFASVAPIAGVNTTSPCEPSRPMPVTQVHGTEDPQVSYERGVSDNNSWAIRNGCDPEAVTVLESGETTCWAYERCDRGADVSMCSIDSGQHWIYNTPRFSTTEWILDFFEAHPMWQP